MMLELKILKLQLELLEIKLRQLWVEAKIRFYRSFN